MPSTRAVADWTRLMIDASFLCADAGMVMALRSWRVMGGGWAPSGSSSGWSVRKFQPALSLLTCWPLRTRRASKPLRERR